MGADDITFLTRLEEVIRKRLAEGGENSYTAALAASGGKRVAQKVGEEGVELALASVAGSREEQLSEAADLVFHLLVLLQTKGIALSEVVSFLEQRHEDSTK